MGWAMSKILGNGGLVLLAGGRTQPEKDVPNSNAASLRKLLAMLIVEIVHCVDTDLDFGEDGGFEHLFDEQIAMSFLA